jgi:steroid 5-alpha reductase family enzyme
MAPSSESRRHSYFMQMNELILPLGVGLGAVMALMAVLWGVSLPLRNSSIVDVFWGPTFALQGAVYFALTPDGSPARKALVLTLVTVWAARLAIHIATRNAGKGEDPRYAAWRRAAGLSWWWRSLFKVFVLQGLLAWFIGLPLYAAQAGGPADLTWLDALGVAAWGIGFFFEAVGDWQLRRWIADPANRGRTLRTGLWRFSRHPNYFGDAAQWWGFWLIAAAAGGWWTVLSPVAMTFLLVRVSGVGMLERTIVERRPDYAEYMRTTSAFVPWLPRG